MRHQPVEKSLNPDLVYEKLWLTAKVIESTMEGLLVTDTSGKRIQIVNPAFTLLSGFEPEEAVGHEPVSLFSADFSPTLDRRLWQKVAKNGSWQGKLWLRRKDGKPFLAWTSISTIPSEHEDGNRHIVLFTDITGHQQAEQQQELFTEVTAIIDKSAGDLSVFQRTAQAVVSHGMAGCCLIHLATEEGIRTVGIALCPRRADAPASVPSVARVMQSGTEEVADHGSEAIICAPISFGQKILGTITFATAESDRVAWPAEPEIARELAHRLSQLIDISSLNHQLLQFRAGMDATSEGILIVQADTYRFRYANQPAASLLGYDKEDLTSLTMTSLSPDFESKARDLLDGKTSSVTYEQVFRHPDGSELPAALTLQFISTHEGGEFLCIVRDLSERLRNEEMLSLMSSQDALTRLPNRVRLMEWLGGEVRRGHREGGIALLYLDLDRFKTINDTLGHGLGDQLLYEVGQRLRSLAGENDLIARLGGDEFALVLTRIRQPEQASAAAESIIGHLQEPFLIDGHELHVTPSIGISSYPDDGTDAATLLQHAEIALYRAKQHGRNTFQHYAASLNTEALEQLLMENSLRHALELQQFAIHYQPHIQLETGQVVGAEALVRWHHPDLGIIPANDFIQLAEETGLLGAIDTWMLEECCRQLAAWKSLGIPLPRISVNLSTQQLRGEHFIHRLTGLIETYQIPPECLALEMTERIVIDNPEAVIQVLKEVRDLGVQLSLDDFGTGYSSLSHLKKLPLTTLKIDQSFIRDCMENDDDAAIITAVISMAHSLNLDVIAEGVERKEQLGFLLSLSCDYVQGYVFSRAVPVNQFLKLLRRQPFLSEKKAS